MYPGFLLDLRFGWRLLRRNLETTISAILTMSLAIGVSGTMFSVVNAILVQPLPFNQPDRLVGVWHIDGRNAATWRPTSAATFLDWSKSTKSFESIGAAVNTSRTLTSFDDPETPLMQVVSQGYFDTIGVRPLLGRTFSSEDDRIGANAVMILSYELWQRRFGADASVIGSATNLDNVSHQIIGVMPEGFDNPIFGLPEKPQVWIPLRHPETGLDRRGNDHFVIARLKEGVTLHEAQDDVARISASIAEQYPDTNRNVTARVAPLKEIIVRDVRSAVWFLLASVLLVVLIASANVAHLQLSRSIERAREFALRRALGAGTARVIRQLLSESLVLMVLCAVPGMLLTLWGTRAVGLLIPSGLNIPSFEFRMDLNVILFTLGISFLPAVLLGLIPAVHAGSQIVKGLGGMARSAGASGANRIQKVLVVAEAALSLTLLVGAALMLQSFRNLERLDQGFDSRQSLTFRVSTRGAEYQSNESRQRFFNELGDRFAAIPGVTAVGAAQSHPFYPQFALTTALPEGRPVPEPGKELRLTALRCSPQYLPTMKISLLRGRGLENTDENLRTPVALVSVKAAKLLWGNDDPIGKRVALGSSPEVLREVVGIVADVRSDRFPPVPQPALYLPLEQDDAPAALAYVLRTNGEPLHYLEAVRKEVAQVDRSMPVYLVRSLEEIVEGLDWRTRFVTSLLSIFSALAVMLSVTGAYAALSYVVSQKTREIGVRVALGASRADVMRMVASQGLRLAAVGTGIGVLASLALSRLLSSLLFGVGAFDRLTLAAAAILTLLVSLVASSIPAWRASRVDPLIAIRTE
jgi:putative ABC transport system permease protein